jgi:hypothetical protein
MSIFDMDRETIGGAFPVPDFPSKDDDIEYVTEKNED